MASRIHMKRVGAERSRAGRRSAMAVSLFGVPLLLVACAGQPGDSPSSGAAEDAGPVEIATTTMSITGTHWREIIAAEKGIFQAHGLIVEETLVKPDITVTTLISGDADVSFADATSTVQAIEKGANIVIVGSGMDKAPYSLVVAPDITEISDLKGKTIGAAGSTDAYTGVLFEILQDGGLSQDDVDVVYGSSSADRVAALEGGAIAAGLVPPPRDEALVAQGFSIVAKTLDYVEMMSLSVTAVDRDWAEQNGDTLKKYMSAISEATDWLYDPANKDEAIQILSEITDTPVEASESAYNDYVAAKAFNEGACVQAEAVQELLDRQAASGAMKDTDVNNYISTDYCA